MRKTSEGQVLILHGAEDPFVKEEEVEDLKRR